jgi:hypothetical protein
MPDEGGVELDLDIETEAIMGTKLTIGAAVLHTYALQNFQVAAGSVEFDQPYLVDGFDEAGGAAIHDRNLGAVDLDEDVIDAKAAESRKKVLHRRHGRAIAITEDGTQRDTHHTPLVGGDLGALGVAVGEKKA